MKFKKILSQLNIAKQCRKYELSLWQCPQFLFLVMGIIIIFSILTIYLIGRNYIEDPLLVALLVILISIILFIIAAIIARSFERLAEASRMKSEFVSIVSHQLRSPLSNLRWVIELLMSGKISFVSEEQAEYFGILKENSDKMRELISDLLMVSKIEQKKISLKIEKVSLFDLSQKIIKEREIFAKASNVEIRADLQEDLPEIMTDSFQIKMAMENLLDNAVRYIKGKGQVDIALKIKDSNIYFEIKDTGIGIPEKDQKHIFQKFFRSDNIKRHQTEGSGLGLYIAKSVIEKLGGKMRFKSQEGIGSTFWFTLPIKQ